MRPLIIAPPSSEKDRHNTPFYYTNKKYGEVISNAGGSLIMPVGLWKDEDWEYIESVMDGLLLVGGDDINPKLYGEEKKEYLKKMDPERDIIDKRLIDIAIKKDAPILGICRGMQMLNIYFGGSLYQDLEKETKTKVTHDNTDNHPRDYKAHKIELDENSRLSKITGFTTENVNGLHHQGVKKLGKGLCHTARAHDGLIEAFEHCDLPFVIGIQWHPEELKDNEWKKLFEAFIDAASKK